MMQAYKLLLKVTDTSREVCTTWTAGHVIAVLFLQDKFSNNLGVCKRIEHRYIDTYLMTSIWIIKPDSIKKFCTLLKFQMKGQ